MTPYTIGESVRFNLGAGEFTGEIVRFLDAEDAEVAGPCWPGDRVRAVIQVTEEGSDPREYIRSLFVIRKEVHCE